MVGFVPQCGSQIVVVVGVTSELDCSVKVVHGAAFFVEAREGKAQIVVVVRVAPLVDCIFEERHCLLV